MTRVRMPLGKALDELIDHRGKTPKKLGGDWTASGHRVVSALNIKGSRVDTNDHHYISEEIYRRWMKVPLQKGDVLLTSEAPTGEVAFVDHQVDWAIGQRLFALRGKEGLLDGRYLFYALRGGPLRHDMMSRTTGTTVQGIRQAELIKVEVEFPHISEQRAIAATLGALDDKIESNRRKQALVWGLLAAEWERLTLDGESAIIGSLLSLAYGRALPAKNRIAGGVPVYGSGGVTGAHNEALVNGPAVIVGRKGTVGETHWSHVDAFPIDTTFFVNPIGGWPLLACFFALRSAGLTQMNSDSAVPGLNRDRALAAEIHIPDIHSAAEWSARHDATLRLIQSLEAESEYLATLRDTLLPELLSGRIRVSEVPEETK